MNRSLEETLRDVRDHAMRGRDYLSGSSQESLGVPSLQRDAFLYCLIAIGEALKRVPAAILSTEPDVPWSAIIATRNYLAHNYWEIDGTILWRVAQVELEVVVGAVDRLTARQGAPDA